MIRTPQKPGVGSCLRRTTQGLKARHNLAQRNALGKRCALSCAPTGQHTHFQYTAPSGRRTGCTSISQSVAVGLSYGGPSALKLTALGSSLAFLNRPFASPTTSPVASSTTARLCHPQPPVCVTRNRLFASPANVKLKY
jgi:hypothetical protein